MLLTTTFAAAQQAFRLQLVRYSPFQWVPSRHGGWACHTVRLLQKVCPGLTVSDTPKLGLRHSAGRTKSEPVEPSCPLHGIDNDSGTLGIGLPLPHMVRLEASQQL